MAQALGHQPVDLGLDRVTRAGGDQDVPHPGEVRVGQIGATERAPQYGEGAAVAGRFGPGPRHGDEVGGFARPDVTARRLAGAPGFLEDVVEVVAELEGQADAPARRAQRLSRGGVRPGEGGTEFERPLHGVQRALEAGGAHRAGLGMRRGRLALDVQVLPGHHFHPQAAPHLAHPAPRVRCQVGVRHHVVRPGESQVSGEDRGRLTEACARGGQDGVGVLGTHVRVQRGPAAAQPGAVHHVVVHQRARLDEFEGGTDPQGRLRPGGRSAARPVRPPHELGPGALAAVQGEPRHALGDVVGEHRVEGRRPRHALRQEAVEKSAHGGRYVLVDGGRPERVARAR
uniref:Uncharacterized protein n=1 Tax=Streptomyces avermitilis TaxID=33903 RepID=A0A499VI93_STRAX|nr:hypothetical protein SAVMC3_12780 [Streptomyces avermitilis]